MHRHQYKGRKLSLKRDQRQALLRGLLDSLILYERIETTLTRAKELSPIFDKLVSKAKKGDLSSIRSVYAQTSSKVAAQKLIYDLSKGFTSRNSGYTRIIKIASRLGDNSSMAVIELVLDKGYQSGKQEDGQSKDKTLIKDEKKTKVGSKK